MNNPGHLKWIVLGALVGFGASFIFGDLITLPLDLYYLIYFGIIVSFFTIYIKKTQLNLKEWYSRRWAWGVLLGLIFGAVMVQNVLSRPATEKFTGPYLEWLIFWRGLVYGAIDGLLLSAFPWIVTWRAFNVEKKPLGKQNSIWSSGLVFHSCGYDGLSFRLLGFPVKEDHSAQYRKYHYFHSDFGISKPYWLANHSCDHAHRGCYPLP